MQRVSDIDGVPDEIFAHLTTLSQQISDNGAIIFLAPPPTQTFTLKDIMVLPPFKYQWP